MQTLDTICPICLQENGCQIDTPENCWCMSIVVNNAIFHQLQIDEINKYCICKKCLESATDVRERANTD